jgi:cysteine-rich repeat protein
VKRKFGLVGLLSLSCTIRLLLQNFPECDPAPPTCNGEVSVSCVDGKIVTLSCAPDLCDPDLGLCRGVACGDGLLDPVEQCDDGNNNDGDGCNSLCIIEFCGDGVLQPDLTEECDDGNTLDGDSCSSLCIIEFCGDGALQPDLNEQCDDNNAALGDGCNAECQLEIIAEVERNDDGTPNTGGVTDNTGAEAVIVGDDFSAANANGPFVNAIISATFDPIGDEDVFEVVNPSTFGVVFSVETSTNSDFSACLDLDTGINLRDANGLLLASDDDIEGVSTCSLISDFALAPGESAFVHITVFPDDVAHGDYFLRMVTAL